MKLTDAAELMKLRQRVVTKNSLTAIEVARRVFQISAAFGEPYESVTPEIWAKMWLGSRKFHLAEISPSQIAVPYANKISAEKVRRAISASADGEIEPIVVDINRQGIGKTIAGYTPKIIVVDGKHRHKAQLNMGKDKILAWVGDLAMAELQRRQNGGKKFVIQAASGIKQKPQSPLVSSASLYAAISVKPASGMTRQDAGDGGSRPTGGTRMSSAGAGGAGGMGGSLGGGSGANPTRMRVTAHAPGARSSGTVVEPDPSDTKVPPDPSDSKTFVDPSDRAGWNPDKAQLFAPGGKTATRGYGSSEVQSPGSGVGPRAKNNWGGHDSDFSKGSLKANRNMDAGPIRVKKIVTKKKKKMEGYGTSEGVTKEWDTRGRRDGVAKGSWLDRKGISVADFDNKLRNLSPAQLLEYMSNAPDKRGGAPDAVQKGSWLDRKGISYNEMSRNVDNMTPSELLQWMSSRRDKKDMAAVAPPGRENQVKTLKKKFGKTAAFKIAWSQYNKD